MPDLRERRHRETADTIVRAALALFAERGFDAVTMVDIADRAAVSRRTLYRRFATKDDLVLAVPRRWLDVWDAAAAGSPTGESAVETVRRASLAVAGEIASSAPMVLVALAVARDTASLRTHAWADDAWQRRVAALVSRDLPRRQRSRVTARYAAGAFMGAIEAMLTLWAEEGGQRDIVAMTREVLDLVDPIWPAQSHGWAT